ncbi:MAG TPA: NAD(+) kinase [Gammaproteobacteria bacterium]
MAKFKKIALTRNIKSDVKDTLQRLYDFLRETGSDVYPDETCRDVLKPIDGKFHSLKDLQNCDLAIVIGGDGTLLNSARVLAVHQVPIVGINMGRLGFLVDVSPGQMLDSLNDILRGRYITEERFLLTATVLRGDTVLAERLALNDIIINNQFQTRMIEFFTHVDGRYVNHERADGIIIATPTGSTAYALSSGGPILHPALSAIALVPICPHTLSHRPLVIDSSSEITIAVDPDCKTIAQVSFDGQANIELKPADRIQIKRSSINAKLLHPRGYDFFDILRMKLNWGKQLENDRGV